MRKGPVYEHRALTQLRRLLADFVRRIMWFNPRAVPLGLLVGKAAVGQSSLLVFMFLSVSYYFTNAP